jgi:hypothetical protein
VDGLIALVELFHNNSARTPTPVTQRRGALGLASRAAHKQLRQQPRNL